MQKAWLRLALSGASKPPKIVIADHDLIEYVAKNEGPLGFVRQADLNEIQGRRTDIKVIKVEGKLPEEEGYIFSE